MVAASRKVSQRRNAYRAREELHEIEPGDKNRIAFQKMDVEGFEAEALKGATRLFVTCLPPR